MPKFYLTTPIYYVNDVPHLGHAYTTIAADVLARYKRLLGYEVMFLTGTDEHGQKVQRAAQEVNERPIELADRMVDQFQTLWRRLNISNDDFIRTTEYRHLRATQAFWNKLWEKGDIYLDHYEGWYCTPCETFWPETQLLEGNLCPDCRRPTEKLKEESYFFRMSKYQEPLLKYIEENPNFIQPSTRRNEIISFVKSGLKDLSVSRTSFDWGIPVPQDSKHVMYVWVDALANYISAPGYLEDPKKFTHYWPADVHIIGKDILRFHAVYWPAMLMAAGLPLPRMVFGHGWWTVEGRKMSKSVRNVVEPHRLIDEFGVDPLRYFVLREVPFGLDGDFSRSALVNRINSDLANDLGNLLSRTLTMVHRYCHGQVPDPNGQYEGMLVEGAQDMITQMEEAMELLAFNTALIRIWDYVGVINKYVDQRAPWMIAKDDKRRKELESVLYNTLEALRMVALMVSPFMPQSAQKMWNQLGLKDNLPKVLQKQHLKWGQLEAGSRVEKSEALFPRLEGVSTEVVIEEESAIPLPPTPSPQAKKEAGGGVNPQITIEEFGRLDLRVAQVKTAEAIPGSNKLIKMQVDLGYETRQIVAGIAQSYKPEELAGKKIILVVNLKPAKLMGIESRGMVLTAGEDAKKIVLLSPEKDVPLGSKVK